MIKWWSNRKKSDIAWKVKVEDLKKGFDLDMRNPHQGEAEANLTAKEIMSRIEQGFDRSRQHLEILRKLIK
jgi:type I restriction enzyme M protein